MAADYQTVTMTFFLVPIWLLEVLWSFFSVQPLSWSSPVVIHNRLFVTCHNSMEKWLAVVAQNKRRRHFTTMIFLDFRSVHETPTYQAFSPFSICFKCRTTIKWLTLSSSATFRVIIRALASIMALNCHYQLLIGKGQPLSSSSSRLSSPLQKFLNHHSTVCSLTVSWAK